MGYGVPGMVTGVLLSGTVGIDEIPGLGSWRWERRSEGGNRGNTGLLQEASGGHGEMLGTVGLRVRMGQLQVRRTWSEEVLEGVWGSVGGYRASLGVLLGKHWGGYWGFEGMMGGL